MKNDKNYGFWNSISLKLYELHQSYKQKPERKISTRSMPGILFLILLFYLGLGIFTRGGMLFYLGHSSESWPQIEGKILSSKIVEDDSDSETMYSLDISYEYSVDNRIYKSSALSYDDLETNDYQKIQDQYHRFPRGPVAVYYDPVTPENSVLQPGATFGSKVLLFFGALKMLSALAAYFFPKGFTSKSSGLFGR